MTPRPRSVRRPATVAALACATALAGSTGLLPVDSAAAQDCAAPATTVVRTVPAQQTRLAPQRVWPLTRGAGVTVAVIDSGVDASVPQLAGHVLAGVDVIDGGGRADSDCVGHGTFVAGLIAAQPVSGIGFAGIAPDVRILPIRQTGNGQDGTADTLAQSIDAAVAAGAQVINVSVVSTAPDEQLRRAVAYALAHDVVVVAAAANDALAGDPVSYPAAYPGVIAVGAVDGSGKRSDFSETGSFVDLVAPGTDVLSLGPGGPGMAVEQGTSFAAPFVTGVAALIRSYRPNLTPAQVERRLELTADHPGTALPDPQLGWGMVNPYAAVASVLPGESGPSPAVRPAAGPLDVPRAATDHSGTGVLLALCGGAGLLACGAAAAVALAGRGRRRGWLPAS